MKQIDSSHKASVYRRLQISFARRFNGCDLTLTLMVLPFVIFIIMFYYAQLFGWTYAFVNYLPGRSLFQQEFVGFKYFLKLFAPGSRFPIAFKNTLIYGFLGILASPIPALMAVFLAELPKGRFARIIQTVTSFPNFISWVLVFSVCFMFFSIEGKFSQVLVSIGLWKSGYNLLADESVTYILQTLLGVWKSAGWTAIIYLSTIAGIDPELYDAAAIDGAGRWHKMYHITIKSILPTYFVMLVLQISGLMNAGFEQFFVFHNSLVADKVEVLATFAYRIGIGNGEISYGTAIGMTQSIISIVLLFSINKLAKKVTGSSVI
ncbi:MAG TPA: sugar ABC transporter permease [Clostridiales bacterium]|nr:sugar ABC transporter permease [Clostridiales bacterium]